MPDELEHGGVLAARHRRPSLDVPAASAGSVWAVAVYVEADRLEAGLGHILDSPAELGTVELVVRRPSEGEREVLEEGMLDYPGLVGDRHTLRGDTHAGTEITLMNARVVDLVADGDRDRWPSPETSCTSTSISECREPSARNASAGRLGHARGQRGAAHGLREVHGAIRLGRDALHQRQAPS